MRKATPENIYTENVEEILKGVSDDLKVVQTVRQSEVVNHLDCWKKSMEKEIQALEQSGAIRRLRGKEAAAVMRGGERTMVHGKCVYTVKPPDHQGQGYKRKTRIVACGNQVESSHLDQSELYSAGATSDLVRIVLGEAGAKSWDAAVDDVKSAFLSAPIPDSPSGKPRYALKPPRVLQLAGLVEEQEAWEVDTALYGFRQSPKWWSDFRNAKAKHAEFDAICDGKTVRAELKVCKNGSESFQDCHQGDLQFYHHEPQGDLQFYHHESRGDFQFYHHESRGDFQFYHHESRGDFQFYHHESRGDFQFYQHESRRSSESPCPSCFWVHYESRRLMPLRVRGGVHHLGVRAVLCGRHAVCG